MRPQDIPASVIRRTLINLGKSQNEEFHSVLERFARERWAFRLAQHAARPDLVLKGATLLPLWVGEAARPTHGLDLQDVKKRAPEALRALLLEICAIPCPADGLMFGTDSLEMHLERTVTGYVWTRCILQVSLGAVRMPLLLGIAAGESPTPPAEDAKLPPMVPELPVAPLRVFTVESFLAEKLHMCMGLGFTHQRMQDLYDMYAVVQHASLQGARLTAAIRATLDRRMTRLPAEDLPPFLTPDYIRGSVRNAEWQSFRRKQKLKNAVTLPEMMTALQMFFITPLEAMTRNRAFTANWQGSGLWE